MTASVQQLSDRLRAEIGDIARSFTDTFTGDGITSRFQLSQAPVQGYSLVVTVTTPAATATVTAASANGTTVTYTSANSFTVGQWFIVHDSCTEYLGCSSLSQRPQKAPTSPSAPTFQDSSKEEK